MRKLSIGEKMFLACYNVLLKEVHKAEPISESRFIETSESDDDKNEYRAAYGLMKYDYQDTPRFSDFHIWGY